MPEADARPFWERKRLEDMSNAEWESLCDGCAKCCLEKLEDVETGNVYYTEVGCPLLNCDTCRCRNYPQRKRFVPTCEILTPKRIHDLHWMPSTCAYRLLANGEPLPDWHPLITGDPGSVHRARQSVQGRAIDSSDAGDFRDHVVTWPE